MSALRHQFQELRELGLSRTCRRVLWECKTRSGLAARTTRSTPTDSHGVPSWPAFPAPKSVADAMRDRIPAEQLSALQTLAGNASRGVIRAFQRWDADYGSPIDWHRNPTTGRSWPHDLHWSKALRAEAAAGDVKLTWEIGRFPQAYWFARAAAYFPPQAQSFTQAFLSHFDSFLHANPFGVGVHWGSGQEVVFRSMAWLFARSAFQSLGTLPASFDARLAPALVQATGYVAGHIEYAQHAVYNNHLLSEAFGLLLGGLIFPSHSAGSGWSRRGLDLLNQQADAQIYPDGGYIQQSHNYHRLAVQVYLYALSVLQSLQPQADIRFLPALERSLEFLLAHQNPTDGSLPNYGANDGALPCLLSTCDYSDFRPTLQAASLATRGERLYPAGPWDEEAAWLLGPDHLSAPQRSFTRRSVSFAHTGFHVLRANRPDTFAAFRCGTLRDRFSQIDMLHLDVWWKGHNVLTDPGSYLYNGPAAWNEYCMRTAGHNTLQVDGLDQMLHYRRFKCLYWTKARLLRFEDSPDWTLCEGEHYGFQRTASGVVHRRSVWFRKDGLWVVADHVLGSGTHDLRLHWLAGDFPVLPSREPAAVALQTPSGAFHLSVLTHNGQPLPAAVAIGQTDPPRGWLSRYYGEKTAVPSIAVTPQCQLPVTLVSVLGPRVQNVHVAGSAWSIETELGSLSFDLQHGRFQNFHCQPLCSSLS